ncbi:MAG: hypothetical protein K0U78_15375 [Actinomycetia bacterium]|nr:hypothetical protein [Actinomycetes bacterium]
MATLITVAIKKKFEFKEAIIQFSVSWAVGVACILIATMLVSSDYEIWNGKINSKSRIHDYWLESYDCNCYQTCSGSGANETCTETCSTCYTDHYTVDWNVNCSVGKINIKSLDWESKRVYDEPDPKAYKAANKGDFCATENSYTNYIKGSEGSLFNLDNNLDFSHYEVPTYPRVHSYYKVNRVFGFGKLNKELNEILNSRLRILGPQKQANIILIGTEYDESYRYAVEQKWLGGKKNDIIVIVGLIKDRIDWVDTITLGSNIGNELMTVKINDEIMSLKTVSNMVAVSVLNNIEKHFDRKPMEEFEYLKDEIKPSFWMTIISILLCIACNIGIFIYFNRR